MLLSTRIIVRIWDLSGEIEAFRGNFHIIVQRRVFMFILFFWCASFLRRRHRCVSFFLKHTFLQIEHQQQNE